MDLFATDAETKQLNQQGKLAPRQKSFLYARMAPARRVAYVLLLVVMIVAGVGAVVAVNNGSAALAVIVALAASLLSLRIQQLSQRLVPTIQEDLQQQKVKSIQGVVRITDQGVQLKRQRFELPEAQRATFTDSHTYRLYYAAKSKTVVAAELVQGSE